MAVRLKKVRLKNCFQHRNEEFEFADFTVIVGANGSGKSNLLESIIYGLGCKFGLPGTKDTMITHGEEKGRVDITLEHEGEEVDIYAKLGASNRSVSRESLPKKISSAGDALEYIQSALLGAPFDVVTQSSIIRQMGLTDGLFDTPAKRMATFMRLAGLREIETKRKQLSDEKDRVIVPMLSLSLEEVSETITSLEGKEKAVTMNRTAVSEDLDAEKLKSCNETLDRHEDITIAKEDLAKMTLERDEINTINLEVDGKLRGIASRTAIVEGWLDQNLADYEKAKTDIALFDQMSKAWEAKQALIEQATAAQDNLDLLVDPGEYTGASVAEARDLVVQTAAAIAAAEKSLVNLADRATGGLCPTCETPLSDEQVEKLVNSKLSQKDELDVLLLGANQLFSSADQARNRWQNLSSEFKSKSLMYTTQLSGFMASLDACEDVKKPVNQNNEKLITDYAVHQDSKQELQEERDSLVELKAKVSAQLTMLTDKVAELEVTASQEVSADDVKASKAYIELHAEKAEQLAELNGQLKEIGEQLTSHKEKKEKLEVDKQKAEELNKYLGYIEFARHALHRDNFPSGKVKAFVDKMLVQTNEYLEEMQAGFSVTYDNEDGFTAHFPAGSKLQDREVEMRADRLSGGERCIFALAFRFSVNDLRSDTGFIILDEPTAPLDSDHVDHMVEALARVKSKLSKHVQVIIITHDERLMTVGDKVIQVA